MASSGAMADFGRMPTSRKVLVFVVMGGLLGFLYFRLAFKPLNESLDKAKKAHAQNTATNKTLEDDIPKFNELRAKKEMLEQIIVQQQKALPTEAEVPAFFQFVEQKVTEAGVDILKWKKKNEEAVERFVKVPLEIELTGNFLQIKRFFASLVEKKRKPTTSDNKTVQERERIVSIEDLALINPTIRNREIYLTAKFVAVTYRQADVPVPAPGQPGAPPPPAAGDGAAPAMPSTGSTPPPMPSAGTPQGAKLRTEDALDKGVDRTKDGLEKAGGGSGSDRLKGGQ
jgi:type IV pilus assembly protein PilO